MVDVSDFLSNVPTIDQILAPSQAPAAPPPGQPTGTGNWLTAGLGSGFYSGLGSIGQGAEAAARAVGASGVGDSLAGWAQQERNTAATYARPDLEAAPWYSPTAFAYHAAQMLPSFATVAGGAALGEIAAPALGVGAAVGALGGGALGAFPGAVGENIQRARDENQPVDQGTSLKALGLGVPEAALQAVLPAMGEGMLAGRIGGLAPKLFGSELAGKAAVGAATGAAVQVPAAAAGEALMQQMGDPNRSFAQRSQDIVNAALSGGVQGAFFGGVIHSFAKKPAAATTNDDLLRLTSQPLGLAPPETPLLPAPGTPGTEPQLQPPQRFQQPPEPPGGAPAPPVATTPAQPGQAILGLPSPTFEPGSRAISGQPIITPPPLRAPVPDQASLPPPVLEGDRPISGQPVITPPPAGGDVTQMSGADLISSLRQQGTSEAGQRVMGEIASRLKGQDIKGPDDIRTALLQQDADKASAQTSAQQTTQIKQVTRGFIPDYLKPHLGDAVALKGAIFDEAQARDQADKPLGTRLTAIAKSFGVLGDDGKLVDPRAAQEAEDAAKVQAGTPPVPTAADVASGEANPEQGNPVPARVLRDAIPEQHQAKWDQLEALRNSLPDNLMHLAPQIDGLQSKLASPKRGEVSSIVRQTRDIREAIDGSAAVEKVSPTTPAPEAAPTNNVVDETQGAKKFTGPDTTPTPLPPSPEPALSKQDQLKAKQTGASNAVQERSPAPVSGEEPPQGGGGVRSGDATGQASTREVQAPAGAQIPRPAGQGQVALDPKAAKAIAKPLAALRKNLGTLMERTPLRGGLTSEKSISARNSAYQGTLTRLDKQQQVIGKALKSGDLGALRGIKDDHFDSGLVDEHYDNMDLHSQHLIDEQSKHIDQLLDAVHEATGQNHARSADTFSSREPTAHDQAISGLIDQGASARDVLTHIARNGSNSIRRTIAAKMLQMSKADPTLRFGSLDEAQRDHPQLQHIFGDYHDDLDRIRVFDKADLEHTMLHEFAHAATVKALDDPAFKARAQSLLDAAKSQMNDAERGQLGLKNTHEFLSEALTNSHFANLLDTMRPPRGVLGSIWQGIKDAVRGVLGLPKNAESLLDHVEHLGGEAVERVNNAGTAQGMNRTTGLYARSAVETGEDVARKLDHTLDITGIPTRMFRTALKWRTLGGIAQGMARYAPSLLRKVQDTVDLHNYGESMNAASSNNGLLYRALDKAGKADVDMAKSFTFPGIDPTRSPAQHTWMSAAELKNKTPEIQRANNLWRKMNSGKGDAAKAYLADRQDQRANGFAVHSTLFDSLVGRSKFARVDENNRPIKINPEDSMAKFHADITGMKADPRAKADFWQREFQNKLNQGRAYMRAVDTEIERERDPAKKALLRTHVDELSSWERNATRHLAASAQAPNFPLYRDGTHYVAGKFVKDFTEAHVAKLQSELQKAGFHDVLLSHNVDNNQIYIRTNGQGSMSSLRDVFNKLAEPKHGVIEPGTINNGLSAGITQHGILPSHISAQIRAFNDYFPDRPDLDPAAKAAYDTASAHAKEQMAQQLLDILPQSSMSKLFAERQNVQGASTLLTHASEERALNTARGIAHIAMANRMADTRSAMLKDVDGAKRNQALKSSDQIKIQSAVNEAILRDAQRSWKTEKSAFDGIRKLTHVMELGFSVPYTMALGTQTWTLGHAELTKHFGGVKSAATLAKAQVKALKIQRAVLTGDDKWASIISPDKLAAAGISKTDADFMLHQDNYGTFNNSRTQWTYDGVHHTDGWYKNLHDVSSAWTLYSEMHPRYSVALAARDLYNERAAQGKPPMGKEWNDVHSFVDHVVNQSQFRWNADLNPRAFGKQGVFGAASPLAAQFQGFRGMMIEKLHREFADAFGANGADKASQARRFLLTHVAAQAALAGTLGLPFVGTFTGLYDKLSDWATGENTHDIRASYRGWLANVFGPGMGEALAHGVPRLGGIDISEHLGEDRLLPLTQLIQDKRKFEDAIKDQIFHMSGSAVHLGTSMVEAGRDMVNGDYLEAMSKALPETLRNVAEGEIVRERGYTDKSGFKYPGPGPTGGDVAAKMLGFTPADEANYQEKEQIAGGVRDRTEFDQQNIMTHLARSFNLHDPAGYQYWMQQSQDFGKAHPGQMPPAAGFGDYLREHARSAGVAGALGTPLGTSPRDRLTRGLVSYGNLGDQ